MDQISLHSVGTSAQEHGNMTSVDAYMWTRNQRLGNGETQGPERPFAKQSGDQASPESGRAASGFRRTGQHRPLRTPPHPPGWGRNHPQNETVVTQLRRELAKGQGWVLAESQAGGEEPQGTSPPL